MRFLSLSLVLTVLMSMYGVGLGLNWLYDVFDDKKKDVALYPYDHLFPRYIARLLNETDDLNSAIRLWNGESDIALFVEEKSTLDLPDELDRGFKAGEALILESSENLIHHYYLPNHAAILTVEFPHPDLSEKRYLNLLFTLAFYLGVLVLIAFWLLPLVGRLQRLNASANLLGQGEFDTRIPISNMSYINHIERAFNVMAKKISGLLEDNKILSRAVSHDLKTPLARLRFGVDMLAESDSDEQREQCYQKIDSDLDTMQALIDALLDYAKLDESAISLKKESVGMKLYIEKLLSFYTPKETSLREKRIVLSKLPEDVFMSIDKTYFAMALNNLIVNALRYSISEVLVSLTEDENFYMLSVEDDGPGIPADQRQRLLKPFQRGESGLKGHGLGLAICEKIIGWHGGVLVITDSQSLGGANFVCRIPKIA